MASKSTTNFRSYEAQARLLAAVIATAKPRLDYKGKLNFLFIVTTSTLHCLMLPLPALASKGHHTSLTSGKVTRWVIAD